MAEYLSPGVYVEEFDSGGQPLEGVSTSTGGFIGLAQKGKTEGLPELVTSFGDFQKIYGSYLSENAFGSYRYLAYAVEHFFANGGSRCYVMRVAPGDAKPATNAKEGEEESTLLQFEAKNSGEWGNKVRLQIVPSSKAKTPIHDEIEAEGDSSFYRVKSSAGFRPGDVVVFDDGESKQYSKVIDAQDNVIELEDGLEGDVLDTELVPSKFLSTCEFDIIAAFGDDIEVFERLSFNEAAPNFVEKQVGKSEIFNVTANLSVLEDGAIPPLQQLSGKEDVEDYRVSLSGGSNGSLDNISPADYLGEDKGPGKRTGIQAFIDNDEVSIMAIPGVTDPAVQLGLVSHCENLGSRFAILDFPKEDVKVADVLVHRNIFDSNYAALYNPWLLVFDPLDKRNIFIPPSGSMAGIYARSDNTRGIQKAPANEVIKNCLGLNVQYNKGEQDILNPKGVNLIRSFTGQGVRVWGARTATSNSLWKYINVRRLFIFLEESIKAGTNWVVFEPNDEQLWARVERTIDSFLTRVWRDGALMGSTASEAFYINIGRSTMTQDDIDNGRLVCVIGVAPVKPAEFVIFRITQKTSEE